jgi:hypothetical protein
MTAKAKQPAGGLPAVDDPANAEVPTVTFGDRFLQAGELSVEYLYRVLCAPSYIEKLSDPEWLRDPENRRIAALLIKAEAMKKETALGVMSVHARAKDRILETSERQRKDARIIRDLAESFQHAATEEGKMRDGFGGYSPDRPPDR